jgi:hypothetical protein
MVIMGRTVSERSTSTDKERSIKAGLQVNTNRTKYIITGMKNCPKLRQALNIDVMHLRGHNI